MIFSRLTFGLLFLVSLTLVGCGSSETTVVPQDPNATATSDAEGSFPDADAEEMKQMEEAAAAGEAP